MTAEIKSAEEIRGELAGLKSRRLDLDALHATASRTAQNEQAEAIKGNAAAVTRAATAFAKADNYKRMLESIDEQSEKLREELSTVERAEQEQAAIFEAAAAAAEINELEKQRLQIFADVTAFLKSSAQKLSEIESEQENARHDFARQVNFIVPNAATRPQDTPPAPDEQARIVEILAAIRGVGEGVNTDLASHRPTAVRPAWLESQAETPTVLHRKLTEIEDVVYRVVEDFKTFNRREEKAVRDARSHNGMRTAPVAPDPIQNYKTPEKAAKTVVFPNATLTGVH